MKFIILVITLFIFSGCQRFFRNVDIAVTGYHKVCIDGTEYIYFGNGGAVVHVDKYFKPRICKN